MPDCINLREKFGDKYRIEFDPAYSSKSVPREKLDAWAMVLQCHIGCIFPHGGDTLCLEIERHIITRNLIRDLPFIRSHQVGDTFDAFLFDVRDFDEIAEIVQPYRRPRLSKQQREEMRERMRRINEQTP